jgi:excisionase family DNA binding protein
VGSKRDQESIWTIKLPYLACESRYGSATAALPMTQPPPLDWPEVMIVREAALYMNVNEKTIRRWVKSKLLKAHKQGRIIRIRRRDLDDLFK